MSHDRQPTLREMWYEHFDGLDEIARVHFLVMLKEKAYIEMDDEALQTFNELANRWMNEYKR